MSLLKSARKASEMGDVNFLKALVYGKPGAGKTTLAAKFGANPLILLSEPMGLSAIMASRPDATVVVLRPGVAGLDEFEGVLKELEQLSKAARLPYDSLVIDSLTDVQDRCKLKFEKMLSGRDAMRGWGMISDWTKGIMRAIRDLPMHAVALCLAKEEEVTDGDSRSVYVRPLLVGAAKDLCAGFTNLTVYAHRAKGGAHRLLTTSDDLSHMTKGHPSLSPVEPPDLAAIWRKMTAAGVGATPYSAEAPPATAVQADRVEYEKFLAAVLAELGPLDREHPTSVPPVVERAAATIGMQYKHPDESASELIMAVATHATRKDAMTFFQALKAECQRTLREVADPGDDPGDYIDPGEPAD